MQQTILFSTKKYEYLKNELLRIGNLSNGQLIQKKFPDNEIYMQILTPLENKSVILIGGTISDEDTLELYDLANGIVQLGAASLKIIIPYFAYSTMERATRQGEIVKAKNRAILLSSIPSATVLNNIYLMDLHSEGIPYYFEKDVRCHHIYCKKEIIEACREIGGNDFVLASTDAGRAKWVESLANEMNVKSAFVYKQRLSDKETQVSGINADVEGKNVIIYDDMIRTGSSLMKAAESYRLNHAKNIYAIATHGIFPGDALSQIKEQGIIKKIICMNTHPNCLSFQDSFLEVKSVAHLIYEQLQSTYT